MIVKRCKYHESVMVKEVLQSLHIKKGSLIIDGTLGTGGHSHFLIEAGAFVLGIEADPKMFAIAKERLRDKAILVLGNFVDIEKIAKENNFLKVDGILLDLGVSNLHLKEDDRGFSFSDLSQELDMRINPQKQGVKAMDLLNVLDQTQLTKLFERVLKHHRAKKMASMIIKTRPIKTVGQLAEALKNVSGKKNLNPLTLPMLALRIAVNSELENLEEVIPKSFNLLKNGGRLSIITFHSGEEKIVKRYMNNNFLKGKLEVRLPSSQEILENKRSRSAKLYTYVKE